MFKKTAISLSVVGLLAGAQAALAYEQGDIIVRGGAALVDPNESAQDIIIKTPALGTTGLNNIGVDSDTQLGVTGTYMLNSRFGVELLAATPFEHTIDLGGTDLASTKHLPPTLTLTFYMNEPQEDFQPYFGAGINYTIFFDEDVKSALDSAATFDALAAATGGVPAGTITSVSGTDIDLDDSTGFAFHAGFDYRITDNLAFNVAYWRLDIDTTADITTNSNVGKVKAKVDVAIDPSVYMMGLSYKF